ncbi:hypothetical protein [Gracilibacillus xinjiangensis]|uniref:Sporulation lipoprotein YhcN/YlaJ (Spore_YhcN_YlaJ) n=1 Tax=Gracilibacillus xinjiangensis TaxID=1193282 RepID=A0ABV8X0A4_9BACI
MNYKLVYFTIIIISLILLGCSEENKQSKGQAIDQSLHLSTQDSSSPYNLPSAAQEVLEEQKNHLVKYKAVQTKKDLFIAIQVKSVNQINEQKIAKDIQKKINKKMEDKKVNVTSDQKFLIELEKLQSNEKADQKEIEKKLKDWKKLIKEKT